MDRFEQRRTNMKLTRNTMARAAAATLLVVVIIPFVVFAVPQVVGAEQSYVVVSSSMTPTISPNDAIIVNDISPASVEEGDVIVFSERSGSNGDSIDATSHRVVDVTSDENGFAFKTKGDANEEPDPKLVPADALVGRVLFTIPYIGHVIAFAGTQLGFLTLVALPLGLLVVGELYDLARAARNSREASDRPDEQAETDGGTDADEWVGANETESEE
jgi:signal peptidase